MACLEAAALGPVTPLNLRHQLAHQMLRKPTVTSALLGTGNKATPSPTRRYGAYSLAGVALGLDASRTPLSGFVLLIGCTGYGAEPHHLSTHVGLGWSSPQVDNV